MTRCSQAVDGQYDKRWDRSILLTLIMFLGSVSSFLALSCPSCKIFTTFTLARGFGVLHRLQSCKWRSLNDFFKNATFLLGVLSSSITAISIRGKAIFRSSGLIFLASCADQLYSLFPKPIFCGAAFKSFLLRILCFEWASFARMKWSSTIHKILLSYSPVLVYLFWFPSLLLGQKN